MMHTPQRLKTIRRTAWIVALGVILAVLLALFGPVLLGGDTVTAPTDSAPTFQPSVTPYDLGVGANEEGACDTCAEKCSSCANLHVCAEAQQCLEWGHTALDPDGDGVPCEMLCPGG
jgi:hypothetical protein